ncbi:hypothetical protein, partial [Salmonella sp. s51228]|uniref:hypothetical protein n=1 Tax=Salmonella sp. s51228 TaxID=3159652 RepID=UPI00397F65C1
DIPIEKSTAIVVSEEPRVAYVFTTELANEASIAVYNKKVSSIVEYHQQTQQPFCHLRLSAERLQKADESALFKNTLSSNNSNAATPTSITNN